MLSFLMLAIAALPVAAGVRQLPSSRFHLQEATIDQIQEAIQARQVTTVGVVELYLKRIKAYNGTCVNEPMGILGPISTKPHAGQINALSTLNLRPATRRSWGFEDRKARSLTDLTDQNTGMPDALETAAAQDRQRAAGISDHNGAIQDGPGLQTFESQSLSKTNWSSHHTPPLLKWMKLKLARVASLLCGSVTSCNESSDRNSANYMRGVPVVKLG
jgi:hypothetical protein